mmetsp:Transcript_43876/g.61657  ORF Transcript_43876/g.61657 Transcript_43876/m.61657 type:complete len:215 (-) Transcript_43876:236-880(-)
MYFILRMECILEWLLSYLLLLLLLKVLCILVWRCLGQTKKCLSIWGSCPFCLISIFLLCLILLQFQNQSQEGKSPIHRKTSKKNILISKPLTFSLEDGLLLLHQSQNPFNSFQSISSIHNNLHNNLHNNNISHSTHHNNNTHHIYIHHKYIHHKYIIHNSQFQDQWHLFPPLFLHQLQILLLEVQEMEDRVIHLLVFQLLLLLHFQLLHQISRR